MCNTGDSVDGARGSLSRQNIPELARGQELVDPLLDLLDLDVKARADDTALSRTKGEEVCEHRTSRLRQHVNLARPAGRQLV